MSILFRLTVALLALTFTAAGMAQNWPVRPVRVIVPFTAGGATDVVGRLISQKLGETWGQSVVIENRAGAGGNVGAEAVARSAPDGYTLFFASGSILTVNPHLYKKLPFDPVKDFAPIASVATGPMVVVVHPSVQAKTVKELIALAKAKPGGLNMGSAGVGSQVHMAGENFANAAKIDVTHVPYKGEALGYNDLVAGQIQFMVGNIAPVAPFVAAGKLRALGVTGAQRSPLMPDVPTVAEAALPGFLNTGWFGLFAPAGTPREIVERVNREANKILDTTEMRARLYVMGMAPSPSTPEAFTKMIADETQRWGRIVAERKLQAN